VQSKLKVEKHLEIFEPLPAEYVPLAQAPLFPTCGMSSYL
jgi:hypothetical protein